jgi:hypothetical protein
LLQPQTNCVNIRHPLAARSSLERLTSVLCDVTALIANKLNKQLYINLSAPLISRNTVSRRSSGSTNASPIRSGWFLTTIDDSVRCSRPAPRPCSNMGVVNTARHVSGLGKAAWRTKRETSWPRRLKSFSEPPGAVAAPATESSVSGAERREVVGVPEMAQRASHRSW